MNEVDSALRIAAITLFVGSCSPREATPAVIALTPKPENSIELRDVSLLQDSGLSSELSTPESSVTPVIVPSSHADTFLRIRKFSDTETSATPRPELSLFTMPGDIIMKYPNATYLHHPDQRPPETVYPDRFEKPDQSVFHGWQYQLVISNVFNPDDCRGLLAKPLTENGSRQTIAHTPNKWSCFVGTPAIGPRGYAAIAVMSGNEAGFMLAEPFRPHHSAIVFRDTERRIKQIHSYFWLSGPYFGQILFVADTERGREAFRLNLQPRGYEGENGSINMNPGTDGKGKVLSDSMMKINVSMPKELISLGLVDDAFPAPVTLSPDYPFYPY